MRLTALAFGIICFYAAGCGPTSTGGGDLDGPCSPGETTECYTGPDSTLGVGLCAAGTATCNPDGTWGSCQGQVLPGSENCSDGQDNNCNGEVDENVDLDGDGYSSCQGDCCDSPVQGCASPELVNPGAFDAPGNDYDDDCDGEIDNGTALCDSDLVVGTTNPEDYARAMDLCTPPQDIDDFSTRWGVLSAKWSLPDGTPGVNAASIAVRPSFGTGSPAQRGERLAMLSTGFAAAPGDTNPQYPAGAGWNQDMGNYSGFPPDWFAANNSQLPTLAGCPAVDGNFAINPVMLELEIRVPTNANAFTFKANFFSSEFPEFVCTQYNDFFVVLLDSQFQGEPANPADKNLARYEATDGTLYPVGVNLAFGDTGLFRECTNGTTGCAIGDNFSPPVVGTIGSTSVCTGTAGLAGTGMDQIQFGGVPCSTGELVGGGTGWLTVAGNVVPGETIKLRIAIWDTSDQWVDSIVLLDDFQWLTTTTEPGTTID